MTLPELRRAGGHRLPFILSRFTHHGEHLALDLCRQFTDAVQISRFHQVCSALALPEIVEKCEH